MSAASSGTESWSAPGKAFLIGEFAVLSGAPAAILAIDRRVTVQLEPAASGGWHVAEHPRGVSWANSLADLGVASARGNLIVSSVQCLLEAGLSLPEHVTLRIDSSALARSGGRSLGIGSSAAAVTALVAALAPSLDPTARQALAVASHRRFQGGHGSGYDVACSTVGGFVLCRQATGDHIETQQAMLPDGWEIILLNGATPVSTPKVLQRLGELFLRSGEVRDTLQRLDEVVSRTIEHIEARDGQSIVDFMQVYRRLEARLGQLIGVDIVPADVSVLADEIEALGGACKPSGAGGDELVAILCPSAQRGSALKLAERHGLSLLDVSIDPCGVFDHGRISS